MRIAEPPLLEALLQARTAAGWGGLWHGVHVGLVTDIKDPDAQGRIKVKLPWSPDAKGATCELWARLATLMAGNNRGTWFVPDVDDEVLLAFEAGDPRRPYVLGALWNGQDAPPESMDGAGNNYKKVIRSRNGVKITLDDQDGQESLVLETPGGQKVTLKDGPGSVEIVDSNGNSVKLESAGITINASAKVTVQASQVSVSAGMVQVDAGMSKFSGVVQADTVIANSVISSSYTPGAGNIW
ncbi:type IV secretion protein Rhs [Ramlibacter sp. USB13]|uniref:Type IV secretion protein Rhs n=1 Tax=Ramlibacter cellulosilyticus TaxID=2764187 RepID=A0A923SB33_9BURK|nr:phage baseplate assembly protein V [Ramlibacter cellulosilyticus]MBC5783431.1 type IV secretion protein Rhs [Ramlibacter cellulosilyticus]